VISDNKIIKVNNYHNEWIPLKQGIGCPDNSIDEVGE